MPIEKAPYIRYTEETSVVDYGTPNAEIPVFIAPSKVNVTSGSTTTYQDVSIDKNHIYLINSFKEAESLFKEASATTDTELLKQLRQYFEENSYYYGDEYGSPYVYVIPLPTTATTTGEGSDAVTTQHPTGTDFTNAIELVAMKKETQVIAIIGINDIASIKTELATELSLESQDGFLRIAYIQAPALNTNETYTEYASRIATLNESINNTRICLVEPEFFGYHLAKISNTPYYVEPGYLPFYSVELGVFKELTKDERDKLCMSGLIFGEDDYTLSEPVPRICLGTSSAFGRSSRTDYGTRVVDALLHARRNVDHQVREIYKIVAPQLKRNETSVILRYVQDEVMSYLDTELTNGTLMQYEFSIEESSFNPYCLLVKGKIVPVNSTLAIEFKNTIGAPYSIASDYV